MNLVEDKPSQIADDATDLTTSLCSHLEAYYSITISKIVGLDVNVFRVDHDSSPSWVARVFRNNALSGPTTAKSIAKVLSFLKKNGFFAEACARGNPVSRFRECEVLVTEFVDGGRPKPCRETFRKLGDSLS
jgi:hypothetical protein